MCVFGCLAHMCMYVWKCKVGRIHSQLLSLRQGLSIKPKVHTYGWSSQSICSRNPLSLLLNVTVVDKLHAHQVFVSLWGLELCSSYSLICTANALNIEAPPQPDISVNFILCICQHYCLMFFPPSPT